MYQLKHSTRRHFTCQWHVCMFILFSLSWHVVLTFIRSRLNETARPMVWWNWSPAAHTVTPPVPDSCSECTICFRSACWWKNKAWVQSDIFVKQSSLSLYFQMHFCSYNLLLTVKSVECTLFDKFIHCVFILYWIRCGKVVLKTFLSDLNLKWKIALAVDCFRLGCICRRLRSVLWARLSPVKSCISWL